MSAAYRFTPDAANDLTEIWLYSEKRWGEGQADRYIDALYACCAAVAEGRATSKPVEGLDRVKVHHCGRHYLFFTQIEGVTVVLAVLHDKMDVVQRLQRRLRN